MDESQSPLRPENYPTGNSPGKLNPQVQAAFQESKPYQAHHMLLEEVEADDEDVKLGPAK